MKKWQSVYIESADRKERLKRALFDMNVRAEFSGCGSGYYVKALVSPVDTIKINKLLREV